MCACCVPHAYASSMCCMRASDGVFVGLLVQGTCEGITCCVLRLKAKEWKPPFISLGCVLIFVPFMIFMGTFLRSFPHPEASLRASFIL